MMRKLRYILILLLLTTFSPITAYGEESVNTYTTDVTITIDGQEVALGDYQIMIEDGRTLVPIRWMSEQLGATVDWDSVSRSVKVSKQGREILFFVDDYFVWMDGLEMVLDVPARIMEGDRTMVPLRVAGEALQSKVTWKSKERSIAIDTNQPDAAMTVLKPFQYNPEELEWLAKIIYLESNGEPFEGQVAVGSVIMNRVESGLFPSTIKDVIFQDGQFTPVKTGDIYSVQPNETAYKAAKWALIGKDLSQGALFFYNPKISTSTFFSSRVATTVIGNHTFTK